MFEPTFVKAPELSIFPTVVGFYTANMEEKVCRLRESLDAHDMPYRLCEVKNVHSSITTFGNETSETLKSVFIRYWLTKLRASVLYMDCDLVVRTYPEFILKIAGSDCSLATFNWLSGEENTTYFPAENTQAYKVWQGKAYTKGFEITVKSSDQIICSGAVQFWRYKAEPLELLDIWEKNTRKHPKCRDDHLLDLSFNFFEKRQALNFASLPRAYCRYAWWPDIEPVIDHPEFPTVNQPWDELSCCRLRES